MQVFKTAIKTVLRHPMYLIVYAGFLSMMGVFIARTMASSRRTRRSSP